MSSTVKTIEKKSSVKNGVGRLVLTALSVILEEAVIRYTGIPISSIMMTLIVADGVAFCDCSSFCSD